jgi:hypothetical protein
LVPVFAVSFEDAVRFFAGRFPVWALGREAVA